VADHLLRYPVAMFRLLLLLAATAAFAPSARADRRAEVASEAKALRPKLVEIRRDLHQHPELSNREVRTGRQIAARLQELGIPHRTGVAGNGVVATIAGARRGKTVMVRADIDALPIHETIEVPYRSKNDGVKHACGHDAHTTIGLATAELLWKRRAAFPGTVYVIFQPAEEGPPPGERGGAPLMIAEGLLESTRPEAIFGLHSMPTHRVGTIGWTPGAAMASSDTFRITVTGKQSHGAEPHRGIDPVVIGSQIVLALQTIDSRRIDPLQPVVVTIGVFHAGTRFNVVPDRAELHGTLRTLSPEVRSQGRALIESISSGIAQAAGGSASVVFQDDAPNPPLINDQALGRFAEESLTRTLGEKNVLRDPPRMIAEDFAHFAERVPAFFFFLGVGNPDRGITANLHTADFDIDEDALVVGATAMTNLVLDYLE
jgi:amidohydrolase